MSIRFLTLALAGLLSVFAQAAPLPTAAKTSPPPEDLPAAVRRQVESREAMRVKADEAQAALRAWYQGALDAVKKDAVGKGDLDGVVATDAERDRADRDLTEEEKNALPKLSRSVRDKYDEARRLQATQLKAATTASLQAYAAVLEGLEKRLTQQGKLDDAIATRLERAKVAALLAGGGGPAPAPATPPAPGAPEPAPEPMPAPAAVVASVKGVDRSNPATVAVDGLVPVKLAMGDEADGSSWAFVSDDLKGATIHQSKPLTGYAANGAAVYKVLSPGRAYLALNYQYQGNKGGGWVEERWMEEDFIKHGWSRVEDPKLSAHKHDFIIMTKVLEAGETGKLRCNKYEPPYFITFQP
ncbi:MAG TPA: hypothetical protein VGO11_08950 [Chthoniobacteraceae bacterium]|jgi:hypothetical protein|nr:hypothetical protein [Chthoniobacteraceae bacterium]